MTIPLCNDLTTLELGQCECSPVESGEEVRLCFATAQNNQLGVSMPSEFYNQKVRPKSIRTHNPFKSGKTAALKHCFGLLEQSHKEQYTCNNIVDCFWPDGELGALSEELVLGASLELQASVWLKAPSSCRRLWIRLYSWRMFWKICSVGRNTNTRTEVIVKDHKNWLLKINLCVTAAVYICKHGGPKCSTTKVENKQLYSFVICQIHGQEVGYWNYCCGGTNIKPTPDTLLLCCDCITFSSLSRFFIKYDHARLQLINKRSG